MWNVGQAGVQSWMNPWVASAKTLGREGGLADGALEPA